MLFYTKSVYTIGPTLYSLVFVISINFQSGNCLVATNKSYQLAWHDEWNDPLHACGYDRSKQLKLLIRNTWYICPIFEMLKKLVNLFQIRQNVFHSIIYASQSINVLIKIQWQLTIAGAMTFSLCKKKIKNPLIWWQAY